MPPEQPPILSCANLSLGFRKADGGWRKVVHDVSFSLAGGRTLGIVGESGSGKSTLARAILGYRRAGATVLGGSVAVCGLDVLAADAAALADFRGRAAAMVPQNPLASLTFHVRVGEQVEEVLRTRAGMTSRAARVRCLELLADMGLPDPAAVALRYPHQLSGGQRQRVVIAAALACDPRLIVLDEPTTALDKTTEGQVLALIERLHQRSLASLVLVTHDLKVVRRLCDDVLVMKDGAVVESGRTAELFRRPQTAYAARLLQTALPARLSFMQAPDLAPELCRIESVSFGYGEAAWFRRSVAIRPAVDSVSVEIAAGQTVGVIGESGSGKTTLGLLAAGLLAPGAGEIRFRGQVLPKLVARRTPEQRRRIQMVFQDPLSSLNPRQTVLSAIARPLRLFFGIRGEAARQRCAELLRHFGMAEEYLQRFPRQLSGGQQQRVAIARAFAAEPDLLICDEITSALDASIQDQVLGELLRVQKARGTAMLMITHDLGMVAQVASHLLVMKEGRVVEAGPTRDVIGAPQHAYTQQLVRAAEVYAERQQRVEQHPHRASVRH